MIVSTEAATSTPAPAPQIEVTASDDFTPAERAYFESRGENTGGLVPNGQPAPAQAEQAAQPDADNDDFDIDDDADAPARDPKTGKFVPRSAYLRVKETAKTARTEAQSYRESLIAAKERLAILTEATAPPKQAAAEIDLADGPDIDPEQDIFGYAKQMKARFEKTQAMIAQMQRSTQEDRTQKAFMSDIARFKQSEPAFPDAFGYLVQQRHAELEALGIDNKSERERMLREEARDVVAEALRAGKSPAERLYRLATARGFKPTSTAAAAPNALAEAAKQIEQLETGRRNSASLRGAGETGAMDGGFSLTAYLNSSEAEGIQMRNAYIAKHGEGAWRKVIGG
jgi:hypothetical protein